MRWTPGGISSDIEDRRGMGGMGPKIGCGGAVVLLVLSLLTGKNFFALFDGTSGPATTESAPATTPEEDRAAQFVSFVLDDTQNTWERLLTEQGVQYPRAKLVLFSGATQSGCGFADAAAGPFYCPPEGKVYIDLAFYEELRARFGAPGDFAQAYVIAHEIGHHVQNVLGLSGRSSREDSVRIELQADCFAGIWAHSTAQRDLLDAGDVEEAIGAAAAVGDDTLQKSSGRAVTPETFTHGSSEQRMEWFQRGFQSGDLQDCGVR